MADKILSDADLETLRQLQEKSKAAYRELQHFRISVYPYMTLEERVTFWAGEMERSLHWGEEESAEAHEETAPPDTSFFDQHWYDECIGFDKEFDKILVQVAPRLGLDLDVLPIKRKR